MLVPRPKLFIKAPWKKQEHDFNGLGGCLHSQGTKQEVGKAQGSDPNVLDTFIQRRIVGF